MDIYSIREQLRTKPIQQIPLRVAFYARVSSDKDEQLNSLQNQTAYYTDYIKSNPKWTFTEGYIDEGISGISTEKRENFHRMIDDAESGKFDYIITKEISRFARNTLDSISFTRRLLSHGVAVYFQNDNINTLDEDSEFRLTIMSGVAQDEIRKLSSRIKFGHAQSIKNGVVLGNDNLYGYKKEKGRLTADEAYAPMIRLIFEKYSQGLSTPKLEKLLYDNGWRSFKGKKISKGVIQHIITNPKYKGFYVGNKVKIVDMFTKQQQFLPEEDWVIYRDNGDTVPALVSEEVWDEANRIFNERGKIIKERRSSFKSENLFTGKIICAHDGAAYWLKARYDRSGNNRSRWVCSNKIQNGTAICPSFVIMEEELKNIIIDVLNGISGDYGDTVNTFIKLYEKSISSADYTPEINKAEEKVKRLMLKKEKLLEYNLDGRISDDEFISRNNGFNNEITAVENEINSLKGSRENEKAAIDGIYALKKNLCAFKEITPADINQNIINLFIKRIYAEAVGERSMNLKIVLNTGQSIDKAYGNPCKIKGSPAGRSDNTFKKMIEAQEQMMAGKTPTR